MKADKRWRVRARKDLTPRWPLALDLARSGMPIGVWLAPLRSGDHAAVVVEGDGTLWEVRRLPIKYLVRWCLNRHLRIFHTLGAFWQAEEAGFVIGWVPDQIIEHKDGRQWLAPAVRFDAAEVAEAAIQPGRQAGGELAGLYRASDQVVYRHDPSEYVPEVSEGWLSEDDGDGVRH